MEKKIVFLPLIIFGGVFLVLILGFLGLIIKLVKKGRDSAWKGELIEKKYFEGEDQDSGLKKDYFTLIFKTDQEKKIKVGVDKNTYDTYQIGDKAEKVKGKFHPQKLLVILVLAGSLVLTGCGSKQAPTKNLSACQPGEVVLPNYGDPGKRLTNCFVQYPGEPTREDKSYFIVEDICGQFTLEFVQNILDKTVIKTQASENEGLYTCSYFINDQDYVMVVLNYLSIDNQKKGQEVLGRKVESDLTIPMENYLAWQEDGQLNSLYLILDPNKFLSIQRSGTGFSSQEIINFAAGLAKEIKSYK